MQLKTSFNQLSFTLLLSSITFISFISALSSNHKLITDVNHITSQHGYVSDWDTVSDNGCFRHAKIPQNNNITYNFIVNSPINFQTLTEKFGLNNVLTSDKFKLHSDIFMDYLNEIAEQPYSMSLIYLVSKVGKAELIYKQPNTIDDILSVFGQNWYNKDHFNFRLICGDTLLTSYTYGIALIVTIKVTFTSWEDKSTFIERTSKDTLGHLSLVVRQIHHIQAFGIESFEVLALQMGGKEDHINKIEGKNVYNNDFILSTCRYDNYHFCMDSLYGTSFLWKFINEKFQREWEGFDTAKSSDLIIFSVDQYRKNEVNYLQNAFNVDLSPSYLTDEIKAKRAEFVSEINKIENLYKTIKRYNKYVYHNEYRTDKVRHSKRNECEKYLKTLFNMLLINPKAWSCYRNVKEFIECSKGILDDIDYNKINEIEELYAKELGKEEGYKIVLDGNSCLPSFIQWGERQVIILKDSNSPIIEIKSGTIGCGRAKRWSNGNFEFECKETIMTFSFSVWIDNERLRISCRNLEMNTTTNFDIGKGYI